MWQGQDPNAPPPSWPSLALGSLGRFGLTGARLLPFGTLSHLKKVVLGFPSQLPIRFLQEVTFWWQCLDS